MSEPSDKTLVRRSAAGDERAFVALVRRYEQPLAARIRYQIGNPDHAEDVLQETLLDAWVGLRRLRQPASVRAWLLRIAGNRCNDYFRSPQRRDLPTAHPDLEHLVNRHGRVHVRQQEAVTDVVAALDEVPAAERDAARLFYLEGLTIAEIAARSRTPEGTIKRRLHDARRHMRETFGVAREKEDQMSMRKKGSKKQPFPVRRPDIAIVSSRAKPFAVGRRGRTFGNAGACGGLPGPQRPHRALPPLQRPAVEDKGQTAVGRAFSGPQPRRHQRRYLRPLVRLPHRPGLRHLRRLRSEIWSSMAAPLLLAGSSCSEGLMIFAKIIRHRHKINTLSRFL